MDDESYFTLSNSTLSGNDRFYTDDVKACPENIKHHSKSKFEPKLLVWIAVSSEGMSKPWFVPSKMAMNQYNYKELYLKLILFLVCLKRIIFYKDFKKVSFFKFQVIAELDVASIMEEMDEENLAWEDKLIARAQEEGPETSKMMSKMKQKGGSFNNLRVENDIIFFDPP